VRYHVKVKSTTGILGGEVFYELSSGGAGELLVSLFVCNLLNRFGRGLEWVTYRLAYCVMGARVKD
jgi:hypothetical protein